MADENAVLARIEKLEASNRRLKLLATGPLLALCVVLVSGQARTNQTLEAQEFVLKDSSGSVLGRMGVKNGNSCLELMGKSRVAAVAVCSGDEIGSGLLMTNGRGGTRLSLSSGWSIGNDKLQPGLFVGDGRNSIDLPLSDGAKLVLGRPGNGIVLNAAPIGPSVSLVGPNDKVLWHAP